MIIAAALIGAIAWNLLTWRLGIPSSSSHALIGGLVGATIAGVGLGGVIVSGFVNKVLIPLVSSPVLGFLIAYALMVVIFNVFRRADPARLNGRFRRLQVISAAFMAFSHGSNDAQKTMGIMTLALVTAGVIPTFAVPVWVIVVAATAISLGTAAGGWRIIRTMGQKVVKLDPVHGFAAETTAASHHPGGQPLRDARLHDARHLQRHPRRRLQREPQARPLGRGRDIRVAWVLTIPASALVAGVAWVVLNAAVQRTQLRQP